MCRSAGIRVVMITGDYPATPAPAIARADRAGQPGGVSPARELGRDDDAELADRVSASNVFARIMPEQKLRLVEALQGATAKSSR